jgi:transposase
MPPANRHEPRRAKSSSSDYSVTEFLRDFPDDNACLEHLWRTRYSRDGEHAHCRKCGSERVFKRYATKQGRQSWTCTGCGNHVHPTAGTIFAKSSTSLRLWFHAMYLMTSTRCGISAKQLERELGVHYKTAWRMFNKIRNELMKDDAKPLRGDVEVDETSWGGKPRKKLRGYHESARFRETKTTVLGMVERGGRVKLRVIAARRGEPLSGAVRANVNPNSILFTDDWRPYRPLRPEYKGHRVINHSAGVYDKWLQSYLDEYAWRYNERFRGERSMFHSLLDKAAGQ